MTPDTNKERAAFEAAPAINNVSDIIDAHGVTPGQPERVADIPGLAEALEAAFADGSAQVTGAAQAAPAPTEQWISVADRLPETGLPVLLDIGKRTPIRAAWVKAKTLTAHGDGDFGEYDEAADDWYWPEGWYEWNEHEETHWAVAEKALNWREMPAPPQGAANKDES